MTSTSQKFSIWRSGGLLFRVVSLHISNRHNYEVLCCYEIYRDTYFREIQHIWTRRSYTLPSHHPMQNECSLWHLRCCSRLKITKKVCPIVFCNSLIEDAPLMVGLKEIMTSWSNGRSERSDGWEEIHFQFWIQLSNMIWLPRSIILVQQDFARNISIIAVDFQT